jgi:hypothetical protein
MENNINNLRQLVAHLRSRAPTTAIASLYRGYWTGVLKFGPRHAVEHSLYEALQHRLHAPPLAGAVATCASVMLMQPLDNLHTRHVLHHAPAPLCGQTALRGAVPATLQASLSGILYYATLQALGPTGAPPLLACTLSALAITIALHPLDVIKTQCALQDACAWRAAKGLVVAEGVRGLYRGFPLALVTSVPSHAIAYGTYETLKILAISKVAQIK